MTDTSNDAAERSGLYWASEDTEGNDVYQPEDVLVYKDGGISETPDLGKPSLECNSYGSKQIFDVIQPQVQRGPLDFAKKSSNLFDQTNGPAASPG